LKWQGFMKRTVVVCPRGALYDSALSIKWYKKWPLLKLFKWMNIHKKVRFHATNTREKKAILAYFPGSEILIADNLPNSRQMEFSTLSKEKGKLKCIFIARIHPIKNLHFLLQLLNSVSAAIQLSIVGPMEDATYWQECVAIIEKHPKHIEVVYMGAIPNHELSELLRQHHLFILPTTGENFGHAIFEAFLAGRPVLISDQTPWLNLHSAGVGWEISLQDSAAFVNAIDLAANWAQEEFDKHALSAWNYAKSFIENPSLKKQYEELFHE